MRKLFLITCLLGLFGVSASAQKFALIDMEYILSNIPAYERANEQLNQLSRRWQSEVEALDEEAKTLYKNYQNEAMFLSENQKKERNLQRRQGNCTDQGLPAHPGPIVRQRHHLCFARHRH